MDTDVDPFETVVIAYSQPQAAVLMSVFAWHDIPAYAQNIETVRANSPLTLALGGIPIRVHREVVGEARELLAAAVADPEPPVARSVGRRASSGLGALVGFLCAGIAPSPRMSAVIVDAAE